MCADKYAFDKYMSHGVVTLLQCVFTPGMGFRRGAYQCVCLPGYFFPVDKAEFKYFNGIEIEQYYSENNTAALQLMVCTECAVGCDTCVDASPCLYESQLVIRLPVLILTIVTLSLIISVAIITYNFRFEMVSTC